MQATSLSERAGLCADCRYRRNVESGRRSVYVLCERSVREPEYPKYPRLPKRQCAGYERAFPEGTLPAA